MGIASVRDAEVSETHLSINRKTIVYTLVAFGLLMFRPFGAVRAQDDSAPTATAKVIG